MNREEYKTAEATITKEIKNWDIIGTVFAELRMSESIELEITGAECDCWAFCECHTPDTCQAIKSTCDQGHDHTLLNCGGNCGFECLCECTHTEQLVITGDIKYYSSDLGRYDEINPVKYAEVYAVGYSCQYCRFGCERCKWVNSLLKVDDLDADIIKGIKDTARVLTEDINGAGYLVDIEAEEYLRALKLYGITIPVNKVLQV